MSLLKQLRKNCKLTQEKAAELLGYCKHHYGRIERGIFEEPVWFKGFFECYFEDVIKTVKQGETEMGKQLKLETTIQFKRAEKKWESPEHEIYLGDCLKRLDDIKNGSVDVVVTSPPYNIDLKYNTYKDKKSEEDYINWLGDIGRKLKTVMKDDGSLFLNLAGANKNPLTPMLAAIKFKELGFELQNHIQWIKSISIDSTTKGHFKPINSERFLNHNFEHIFHFTKTGNVKLDRLAVGVPYADKSNIARYSKEKGDKRCNGNVWFIPYKTVTSKSGKFNHPGTFPVELAERCIKLHGKKNAIVLDPFLGTGTTLIAAAKNNCHGIGIEMDSKYAKTVIQRMEAEV